MLVGQGIPAANDKIVDRPSLVRLRTKGVLVSIWFSIGFGWRCAAPRGGITPPPRGITPPHSG